MMLLLSVLIGLQYSSSTASIVRPLSLMDGRRSSCGHHDVPAGLTEHAVATSKPSQIASADAFKSWLTSCDAPAADVHISVLMTNCQQYAEVSGIVNLGDLFTNTRAFRSGCTMPLMPITASSRTPLASYGPSSPSVPSFSLRRGNRS